MAGKIGHLNKNQKSSSGSTQMEVYVTRSSAHKPVRRV